MPGSVKIDPALQSDLLTELQAELTSGGEALTFSVDGDGNLVGTLPSGDVAVTVYLSAVQQGQDVNVTVTITQHVPLDHNGSSDGGYVTFDGDDIHINVPVQATDTDGDNLTTPANVDITLTDGADPSFGNDAGVIINESDDKGTAIEGQLSLNVGSDEIETLMFQTDQPELADLTSNGLATTYAVTGNTITVYDSNNQPVMTATVGTDGSYEITITGPFDQSNASDSININLGVTATDKDGDTSDGLMDITIQDGDDPTFGLDGGTIILETENSQTVTGEIELNVGSDAIGKVEFDAQQTSLEGLTTNGQATIFAVNGNVITVTIDGGINDGTPVLTIAINNDGTYSVKQDEPLDQDNTQGDDIDLNLGIVATDKDGDVSNNGQLNITIQDGQDATGGNVIANLTVVEGDLENPASGKEYPSTGTGNFTVEAVNDNLVSNTMRVQADVQTVLLAELNSLTSNGEPLSFTLIVDGNGVITITGVTQSGTAEILEITLTPTQLTDGDVSVAMAIEQSGPLDHSKTNNSDSYVTVSGDTVSVDIPVQMTDSDGDDLVQPVDVKVTITDGDDPKFGVDSSVILEEGDDGVVSGIGKIAVDAGSDQIVKVYFDNTQASLDGLTSNGEVTRYTVIDDGSTVVVTLVSDPSVVVMEVTVDIEGNYKVDQKQPIDQVDDTVNDNENITLDVLADDNDGDTSSPGYINIVVNDGTNAGGGQTGTIIITEGKFDT